MTKFTQLTKTLLWDRFKRINRIMLLMLLAIVVTLIASAFTHGFSNLSDSLMGTTAFWSFIAFWAVVIRLAMLNESIYTHDSNRLIPVTDIKLYSSSLCASLLSFLYFEVIQFVLGFVTSLWKNSTSNYHITSNIGTSINGTPAWVSVLILVLILIAGTVMMWTTISIIHLIMMSIATYLPVGRQRIIRAILYIIVTLIIVRLTVGAFAIFNNIINFNNLQFGVVNELLALLAVVLMVVIESVINVLLMNRFVETTA